MRKFILSFILIQTALLAYPQNEKDMKELVVTATGTEHTLRDVPVQTEVISRKMIESYGGKSLEEILGGLCASFSFAEGDMGSQMQLSGLGNNYILVLVDGKRLHGDNGGENDLSLIDPHNIERIEIVKGASSALYGSDAMAGVINIITRKHHDEGLSVENITRYGSYNDVRQHNGLGLKWGKLHSYTNFQLQHSDGWQNTGEEYVDHGDLPIFDTANKTVNKHTNWQVAERLTFTPNKHLELYAEGATYWKRIYRPNGSHPKYDVKGFDMQYDNSSLSGGGTWKPSGKATVTMDVDYNRHAYYYAFTVKEWLIDGYDKDGNFTTYFPVFQGQKTLQSDQRRTMASLKGVFLLPANHTLSAGGEWRYDWLRAPMRLKREQEHVTDNTGAIYLQDEYSPLRWLNVTAGLRLTHNQQFGQRLTPKLSAMFSAGPRVKIRTVWSQGFKTPTPKELNYHYVRQMSSMIVTIGNDKLRPQTNNYVSLSGEYAWKGLSFTVTGYYNKLKGLISAVKIPTSQAPHDLVQQYSELRVQALQYMNAESASSYGIDFTANYKIRAFTMGASYSWLNTEAQVYDSKKDAMHDITIDGMAHHKANWFGTWNHTFSPSYRLGLGLYGRASSRRYYQINGDGKAYHIWRLTTTHDLGHSRHMGYRLEAGVDNIFNYVDRTPHGLHLGTTTAGTTAYVTLNINFKTGKKTNNKINTNFNKHQSNEED